MSRRLPYMDEVDEAIVQRLTDGLCGDRTTPAENEEAVRRLNALGMCDRQIAERTGLSERTVFRCRKRTSTEPAVPPGGYWPNLTTRRRRIHQEAS